MYIQLIHDKCAVFTGSRYISVFVLHQLTQPLLLLPPSAMMHYVITALCACRRTVGATYSAVHVHPIEQIK